MKLPVFPKGERDIIDKNGKHVCFANTTEYRDDIVKVINGYDKLIGYVEDFIKAWKDDEEVEIDWELFGDTKIKSEEFLQALKESEKQ